MTNEPKAPEIFTAHDFMLDPCNGDAAARRAQAKFEKWYQEHHAPLVGRFNNDVYIAKRLIEFHSRIAQLEAALEFYAEHSPYSDTAKDDAGNRAREALKK